MSIIDKIEEYNQKGFQISIEVSYGYLNQYINKKDEEDRPYYVNLYYGDSNSPWKPGTLDGTGFGMTLEEAFNNAVFKLKHPVNK